MKEVYFDKVVSYDEDIVIPGMFLIALSIFLIIGYIVGKDGQSIFAVLFPSAFFLFLAIKTILYARNVNYVRRKHEKK